MQNHRAAVAAAYLTILPGKRSGRAQQCSGHPLNVCELGANGFRKGLAAIYIAPEVAALDQARESEGSDSGAGSG
jgi:hypothetical protein